MRRNWSFSLAETWGQIRTSGQKQKERTPYKWHKNGLCAEASLQEVEELACLFACQLSLPTSVNIRLQDNSDWGVSNMPVKKRRNLVIKQVLLGK